MKNNAILFSRVDREDYWVSSGLIFKVNNTNTYIDAYDEIKHKLETQEFINNLIQDRNLLSGIFDDDQTFKFTRTYWDFGLYFEFENADGCIVEYKYSADFVTVFD